jgi:hypothetical protein
MYFLGLILSKVISKSRIQSMIGKYQFNNQEMQKVISTIIEKDTILNAEITQLKDSECDCGNENTNISWHFPVICTILLIIGGISGFLTALSLFILDSYFLVNLFGTIWWTTLTIVMAIPCYYE